MSFPHARRRLEQLADEGFRLDEFLGSEQAWLGE
jgi:hypothetical protein